MSDRKPIAEYLAGELNPYHANVCFVTEVREIEKKLDIAVSLLKTGQTEMGLRENRIYKISVDDFLSELKGDQDEV